MVMSLFWQHVLSLPAILDSHFYACSSISLSISFLNFLPLSFHSFFISHFPFLLSFPPLSPLLSLYLSLFLSGSSSICLLFSSLSLSLYSLPLFTSFLLSFSLSLSLLSFIHSHPLYLPSHAFSISLPLSLSLLLYQSLTFLTPSPLCLFLSLPPSFLLPLPHSSPPPSPPSGIMDAVDLCSLSCPLRRLSSRTSRPRSLTVIFAGWLACRLLHPHR